MSDQPGHSGCTHAGMFKWTCNERALELINDAYSKIGFSALNNASDSQARAVFSLHSHNFISTDTVCDVFTKVIDKIEKLQEEIAYEGNTIELEEMPPFIE